MAARDFLSLIFLYLVSRICFPSFGATKVTTLFILPKLFSKFLAFFFDPVKLLKLASLLLFQI